MPSSNPWTNKAPPLGREVELLLSDGSVLRNAIAQESGDWYWTGAGRDVFISTWRVTAWRELQ